MMIKVRATQDGVYAGYYRTGPIETDSGIRPGEVFEVDDTPYEVKDEFGRPMQEMIQTTELNAQGLPVMKPVWVLDTSGKPKKDASGNLIPKIKMASFFTKEWMERVPDDTEVTNDYEPFQVPSVYRKKKLKATPVSVAMPAVPVESPI